MGIEQTDQMSNIDVSGVPATGRGDARPIFMGFREEGVYVR